MAGKQASGQRKAGEPDRSDEDVSSAASEAAGAGDAAKQRTDEVTAAADELIDEIDDVLLSSLVTRDEKLTGEELEKRAREFVEGFWQKGGQ